MLRGCFAAAALLLVKVDCKLNAAKLRNPNGRPAAVCDLDLFFCPIIYKFVLLQSPYLFLNIENASTVFY